MYLDPDPNHWLFIANLSVGVPTKKRNGILVGMLIFYVSIKNLILHCSVPVQRKIEYSSFTQESCFKIGKFTSCR